MTRRPFCCSYVVLAAACLVTVKAKCTVDKEIGCYEDNQGFRVLSAFAQLGEGGTQMDHDVCAQLCLERKYSLAGVEDGHQCFCGNAITKGAKLKPGCDTPCTMNSKQEKCGGDSRVEVYSFKCSGPVTPIPKPTPAPPTPSPPPPPQTLCPDFSRDYCKPGLPLDQRIEKFMKYMTSEDKMHTLSEQSITGKFTDGTNLVEVVTQILLLQFHTNYSHVACV